MDHRKLTKYVFFFATNKVNNWRLIENLSLLSFVFNALYTYRVHFAY